MNNQINLSNLVNSNGNSKIEYPVTFEIKAIMDNGVPEQQNRANLLLVFQQLKISNSGWRSRESGKGKYISISVLITIDSQSILKQLYEKLKDVPGLKTAF